MCMFVLRCQILVLMIGGVACSHDKPQIVNEHVLTAPPGQKILSVGAFADTSWPYFGFYDKEGTYEHQYGGPEHGYFAYTFRIDPGAWTGIKIRARLSAEAKDHGNPDETSDVTVSIDGIELGSQTVMTDNMKGAVYTWESSDPNLLQKFSATSLHTLRFDVKADAQHRHGLCLYGEALAIQDGSQPAALSTPPSIELTPAKP